MHTITAQELKHMFDRGEDFLLVNTLPEDMFAATKIPGSVNIPERDADFIERILKKAGDNEKTIVVYCVSEECDSSQKAADKLEASGFQDVWKFEGGTEEWKEFTTRKKGASARR